MATNPEHTAPILCLTPGCGGEVRAHYENAVIVISQSLCGLTDHEGDRGAGIIGIGDWQLETTNFDEIAKWIGYDFLQCARCERTYEATLVNNDADSQEKERPYDLH